MKKLFVSISSLFAYPFLAVPAFAQGASVDPCTGATEGVSKMLCGLATDPGKTIQNIILFFVVLAVFISLLYLLYGGVKWITSGGEKTKVEESRNHIIAALIGLIVVILAVFILSIVLAAFGIKFNELVIPSIGGK